MSLVTGKNVMGYKYDGGQWKPFVCGRSCSLVTNAEDIETSISGQGAWRTYEYAGLTWAGSIDGLVYLQQSNTYALPDIRNSQYIREKILFRYQRTDNAGNIYLEEGTALILTVSDTGDYDGLNTYSVALKGTGRLTPIFTPTPINPFGKVKRTATFTTTGGETSHIFTELIGKDLLEVSVDTRDATQILTSGTPVENEVAFNVLTGNITFSGVQNADIKIYALYQDI